MPIIFNRRLRFSNLTYGALVKIQELVEQEKIGEHLVPSGRGYLRIRIDRDQAGQLTVQRLMKKSIEKVQPAIHVGVPA